MSNRRMMKLLQNFDIHHSLFDILTLFPYLCRPFTNHGCGDPWGVAGRRLLVASFQKLVNLHSGKQPGTSNKKQKRLYETYISTTSASTQICSWFSQTHADSQWP